MGFRDRMKGAGDAMKQAQEQAAQAVPGGMGNIDMGGVDMAEAQAEAQRIAKLNASGVDKLAVVQGMQVTGRKDSRGQDEYAIEVQVSADEGSAGDGYAATFKQYLIPEQMAGLATGTTVKVKVDPDDPASMLYWGAP